MRYRADPSRPLFEFRVFDASELADHAGALQDISQAVEYLLDAAYVTGVNIDVAGGYRL